MAKSKPKGPAKALPPLTPSPTKRFAKDVERMKARGRDMGPYKAVILALCSRGPLPPAFNDHPLKGDRKGWRDCRVAPDWIIIYKKTATELLLARTGTHSDLF
jgi:mRNA interferase YafQ